MKIRNITRAAFLAGAFAITAALTTSTATAAPALTASAIRPTAVIHAQMQSNAAYPLRCVITASNVNYRRGPGTQYASYGQLGRGFAFASDGGVPNPRSRYQYWDNVERPGHADAYVDDAYVYCWLS